MLNDFGFAVEVGTEHLFAGTLCFAPTAVLRSYIKSPYIPIRSEPWHDLESAAKLLFVLSTGYCRQDLLAHDASDANRLLSLWEVVENVTFLKLARECDYNSLLTATGLS